MATNYSAAQDLGYGLGDALSEQVSDEEKERKKKLMNLGQPNQATMGLAAMNLLGNVRVS